MVFKNERPWPMLMVALGFAVMAIANPIAVAPLFAPAVWSLLTTICSVGCVAIYFRQDCEGLRNATYALIVAYGAARSLAYALIGATAAIGGWLILLGLLAATVRAHERNELLAEQNASMAETLDEYARSGIAS